MVADLSMKSSKRCCLSDGKVSPTPHLPQEPFALGMFSQRYLTTSVTGWMGHQPREPVLHCLHTLVSPERPWWQNGLDWPELLSEFVLMAILSESKLVPGQVGWESKAAKFFCLMWVTETGTSVAVVPGQGIGETTDLFQLPPRAGCRFTPLW